MTRKISTLIFVLFLATGAFAATFSGSNLPYDSFLYLGLVNGPGSGVGIGADIFFPANGFSYGFDIQTQVTNNDYEQNINILKYGLAVKYEVSEDLFLTAQLGKASFYLSKAVDYRDSFSGAEYSIDENTHGNSTYLAIAPNFRIGEFYLTPQVVFNNISDGGTIAELDLNLGHKF